MSDHDRGGPPHDEPLAFDRRDRPAARGPAPLTLILSVLLLLALAAAIFAFYRGGLSEGARAPKAIGAPVGDLRAAPPAGEGDVDPAAGLKIYQQAEGEPPPLQPNFTPPPEQPLPRPTAPAPTVVAPPAPVAAPPPAPPVASPPPAPVTVLSKTPAPEPAKPAAPPAKAEPKPEPKPAAKPPAAAPAPVPAKPAAAGGPSSVQIGAFSSAAIAEKEWSAAVAKGGGSGRGKRIEKVERDGSTLFRTTVTGFPDRASAQAFCDRLKSAGKSCFVR